MYRLVKATKLALALVILFGLVLSTACAGAPAAPTAAPAQPQAAAAPTAAPPAPANSAPSSATESVYFGSTFALTGPSASWGQPSFAGTKMAVDEINEAGGFKVGDKTYKINLLQADTEGKPEQAVAVLNKQLNENHPPAVFGSTVSTTAVPEAEVALSRKDYIMFSGSTLVATKLSRGGPIFKTTPPLEWIAPDLADYAVDKLGLKSVAMLVSDDDVGHSIMDNEFTPQFKRRGVNITDAIYFPVATTDFSPYITKIKPNKPDAIFGAWLDTQMQGIMRQALEMGVTKNFIGRGTTGIAAVPFKDQIDNYVYEVFYDIDNSTNPKMVDWKQRYQKRFGRAADNAHNDAASFYYYDFVGMLVKAMQQTGTVSDVNALIKALNEMPYDGTFGPIKFDGSGRVTMTVEGAHMRKGGASTTFPLVPKPELAPASSR